MSNENITLSPEEGTKLFMEMERDDFFNGLALLEALNQVEKALEALENAVMFKSQKGKSNILCALIPNEAERNRLLSDAALDAMSEEFDLIKQQKKKEVIS